jgi:hypothetical protein
MGRMSSGVLRCVVIAQLIKRVTQGRSSLIPIHVAHVGGSNDAAGLVP